MATITLSLNGNIDGAVKTVSRSATIDDAVLPYFFACYRNKFGTPIDITGMIPLSTDEAAFVALAQWFAAQGVADTQNFMRRQAIAQISIPNIAVTQNP